MGVGPSPGEAVSETRSLNTSSGATANRCGSAPSTWNERSGTGRSLLEVGEETVDFVPNHIAAREPSPVRADQTDQPVAFVDTDAVALARRSDSVDQKGLDVGFEFEQDRVLL